MSHYTDSLEVGKPYDRKLLAEIWKLRGFQAIGRGVFTPKGLNQIFLFVTRERLGWMTPYNNFLDGDLLFWDGEKGHRSDRRIIESPKTDDEIFLFYRESREIPFTYHGRVFLIRAIEFTDRPSEFVFSVWGDSAETCLAETPRMQDESVDYAILNQAGINNIDKIAATKSRGIAQRLFRGNLLRLWQGACAVTQVQEPRVLISSHIKPWAASDLTEKVDHYNGLLLVPNLDSLFNEGLISFNAKGRVLISPDWRHDDQRRMHVTRDLELRSVHCETLTYLEYHRDVIFKSKANRANSQ